MQEKKNKISVDILMSKDLNCDRTHLIRHHHQRVLVLREEIKKAPKSKSVLLGQNSAASFVCLVIFLGC